MSHVGYISKLPIPIHERYLQIILKFAKCGPPCDGGRKWIIDYGILWLGPTLRCPWTNNAGLGFVQKNVHIQWSLVYKAFIEFVFLFLCCNLLLLVDLL